MEVKHTPGPWTFNSFSLGSPNSPIVHKKIVGPLNENGSKNLIAEVHMQHPAHEADGRLIAAAPELLEALEHMVAVSNWATTIQSEEQYDAMIANAEAAIRKAKGE